MEHIGVVTGLSDLIAFLAAVRARTQASAATMSNVKAVLFGGQGSLPEPLRIEFVKTVETAFPFVTAFTTRTPCVHAGEFSIGSVSADLPKKGTAFRVVYGNGIHKKPHQQFFSYLEPDEFVFFDNGLSSYASHPVDIKHEFTARNIPCPSLACYSLSSFLPIPSYLSSIPPYELSYAEYTEFFGRLRALEKSYSKEKWLPSNVIIGTSLFRTKRISWEMERSIYLSIIDRLKKSYNGDILFKCHPRSGVRLLITKEDGVTLFDSTLPAEAFVRPGSRGAIYSISSTSLLTFKKFFGWDAWRLENKATRQLLEGSPHLSMVNFVESIRLDEDAID